MLLVSMLCLLTTVGVALVVRNADAWSGFPVAPALIADNYVDDICTIGATYVDKFVPWRYGVALRSLTPNRTEFVAIDFAPYAAQLLGSPNKWHNLTMLKTMFPGPPLAVNVVVPCVYTRRCGEAHGWTRDGPNVGRGGLFEFDNPLRYNDSGISFFDIYDCKILTNVTTAGLPHASMDASLVGYALAIVGLLGLLCFGVCMLGKTLGSESKISNVS